MLLPIPYPAHHNHDVSQQQHHDKCTFSIFTLSSVSKIICTVFRSLIVNSFFRHDLHRLIHNSHVSVSSRAHTLMLMLMLIVVWKMQEQPNQNTHYLLHICIMHACTVHHCCVHWVSSVVRAHNTWRNTRSDNRRQQANEWRVNNESKVLQTDALNGLMLWRLVGFKALALPCTWIVRCLGCCGCYCLLPLLLLLLPLLTLIHIRLSICDLLLFFFLLLCFC